MLRFHSLRLAGRKPPTGRSMFQESGWRSLTTSASTPEQHLPSSPGGKKNQGKGLDDESRTGTSLLSEIIRQQRLLKEQKEQATSSSGAGRRPRSSSTTGNKSPPAEPFRIGGNLQNERKPVLTRLRRVTGADPPEEAERSTLSSYKNDTTAHAAAAAATTIKQTTTMIMPGDTTNNGLFDVFQIPEPPKPAAPRHRSPNAYPEESVDQYWEILEDVLAQPKAQKKHTSKPIPDEVAHPAFDWLRSEEPVEGLEVNLPSFARALKEGLTSPGVQQGGRNQQAKREFAEEVQRQRERFCEKMGFTEEQARVAEGALLQVTNICAKHAKGLPLDVIWNKVKESGIRYQQFLHNMLYVSATFSTASLGARRKRQSKFGHLTGVTSILDALDPVVEAKDNDDDNTVESGISFVDMTDEIAIFHDLLYEPTEQTINVRVKLLVAQGNAAEAEALLDANASGKADLRLRGYMPVLRLYLELKDLSSALRLYTKMRKMSTVHLDIEAYMYLIAGTAEMGRFAPSAPPIEGAEELGYSVASGPGLFDELCSEMATEIIEVPEGSGKKLYNALARGFPDSGLKETTSLAPLKVTDEKAAANELCVSRVRINPASGLCPRTGLKLRLIQLEEPQKEKLLQGILSLAGTHHTKHRQKLKNQDKQTPANEKLMEFYRWLDRRKGEPYTTLIDGANVGYYQQNYEEGRFSYHQIQFVVDSLESMGENVLVVLPAKYTNDWFHVSATAANQRGGISKQRLTTSEKGVRNNLLRQDKILRIPPGYLDDLYWILASVSPQTTARKGRDLNVKPGNSQGRWPGTRPVLITNDQMRDHQVEMLEPMLFRRWFSNYIVNYNFAPFINGKSTHSEIGFSPADFFSREIQGNKDKTGSMVWHFPIAGEDFDWFCIRIPVNNAQ